MTQYTDFLSSFTCSTSYGRFVRFKPTDELPHCCSDSMHQFLLVLTSLASHQRISSFSPFCIPHNGTCQGISPGMASSPPTILWSVLSSAVMVASVGKKAKEYSFFVSMGVPLTLPASPTSPGFTEELEPVLTERTSTEEATGESNRSESFSKRS